MSAHNSTDEVQHVDRIEQTYIGLAAAFFVVFAVVGLCALFMG
ncbi:hypothetical protein [Bradyrhizobium jicamae]|nr:hypothetical protein [Bradyrhizobium jicamae]